MSRAEQDLILQAEKFHASVAAPKGKIPNIPNIDFNEEEDVLVNEVSANKILQPGSMEAKRFSIIMMMAKKPWCSWAKTNTQGWNLALKEPLVRSHSHNQSASSSSNNHSFSSEEPKRSWRDDCCWRFNRNCCKKLKQDCDFNH